MSWMSRHKREWVYGKVSAAFEVSKRCSSHLYNMLLKFQVNRAPFTLCRDIHDVTTWYNPSGCTFGSLTLSDWDNQQSNGFVRSGVGSGGLGMPRNVR